MRAVPTDRDSFMTECLVEKVEIDTGFDRSITLPLLISTAPLWAKKTDRMVVVVQGWQGEMSLHVILQLRN